MRVRKLSPEVRARVRADAIARVQAGESTIVVAASLQVTDSTVWRWCVEAGVTFKPRVTAELRAEAVARVRGGTSIVEVARELEVSDTAVRKWCRAADPAGAR